MLTNTIPNRRIFLLLTNPAVSVLTYKIHVLIHVHKNEQKVMCCFSIHFLIKLLLFTLYFNQSRHIHITHTLFCFAVDKPIISVFVKSVFSKWLNESQHKSVDWASWIKGLKSLVKNHRIFHIQFSRIPMEIYCESVVLKYVT